MYKVCITNKRGDWNTSHTGKGKFFARLIPALKKLGVKITTDPSKKADIDLQISRFHYKPNARKLILREGPFTIDSSMNYKKLNKGIWKSVKMADGIIYQSKYSKKVGRKFLGKPPGKEVIIYNGANPDFYENIEPKESQFKYNFLASARMWHPQKRLKQTIKAFRRAEIKESCLWIAGNILGSEKKYESENIRFVGLLDNETLGSFYKLCDALIDITYLSACPNNCIEAMIAGCPVICGSEGGTSELTAGAWNIETKKYKFKPMNLKKPPKIKMDELVRAIKFHTLGPPDRNFPNEAFGRLQERLHIDSIARQYLNFFKKVIG